MLSKVLELHERGTIGTFGTQSSRRRTKKDNFDMINVKKIINI